MILKRANDLRWTISVSLRSETGIRVRDAFRSRQNEESAVIVTGLILLLLGYFLGISILYTVGGILLVIGLVLWIAGAAGHGVGGRPHYW
jgi:hypothetical protein